MLLKKLQVFRSVVPNIAMFVFDVYAFIGVAVGMEIGGVRYEFYGATRSWNAARDTCRSDGGELAKVDSIEVNEYLALQLNSLSDWTVMWLGANDREDENNWVWIVDGSRLEPDDDRTQAYSNWCGFTPGKSQPNGGEFQNCMGLTIPGECWNDFECAWRIPFACEFGRFPPDDGSEYCEKFGFLDDYYDPNRVATPDGDSCDNIVEDFDGRWAACCCAEMEGYCCPPDHDDECLALATSMDDSDSSYVGVDGVSCLTIDSVLASYETCMNLDYLTNTSDARRDECYSLCETQYEMPLAAAYGDPETSTCCCATACLCYADASPSSVLAISVAATGSFNDGSEVLECSELLDELQDEIDDPNDDLEETLANFFDLDDLDESCEPAACLEDDEPDEDCCAQSPDASCLPGYERITNPVQDICYPALGGEPARHATCCVPFSPEEGDDEPSTTAASTTTYLVDSASQGDYSETATYCAARGLAVASISDGNEESELVQLLVSSIIGQVWLGAELRFRRWVWTDGSDPEYLEAALAHVEVQDRGERVILGADGNWTVVIPADDESAVAACKLSGTTSSGNKKKTHDQGGAVLVFTIILSILLAIAITCFALVLVQRSKLFAYTNVIASTVTDAVELTDTTKK